MSIEWVRPMHVRSSLGMEAVPDSAIIISVNSKTCIGRCGGCGEPVLLDEDYAVDTKVDRLVCGKCLKENEEYASLYKDFRSAEKQEVML